MKHLPDNITFVEWVAWVFDRPVTKPEWYCEDDAGEIQDSPAGKTVEFLTRLFEDPDCFLGSYTDDQVGQGLWFLASHSCSDHMRALLDQSVPVGDRARCVRAMFNLFANCFAVRCSQHLGHRSESGVSDKLNGACYMWWDNLPFRFAPATTARAELDGECLAVMRRTLALPHDACRESALHGLGHWREHYAEQVATTIDEFLAANPQLRSELRSYAISARQGRVL